MTISKPPNKFVKRSGTVFKSSRQSEKKRDRMKFRNGWIWSSRLQTMPCAKKTLSFITSELPLSARSNLSKSAACMSNVCSRSKSTPNCGSLMDRRRWSAKYKSRLRKKQRSTTQWQCLNGKSKLEIYREMLSWSLFKKNARCSKLNGLLKTRRKRMQIARSSFWTESAISSWSSITPKKSTSVSWPTSLKSNVTRQCSTKLWTEKPPFVALRSWKKRLASVKSWSCSPTTARVKRTKQLTKKWLTT